MMSKKRFPYIDLIKGIAIFMVITLRNNTWHTDFITSGTIQSGAQFCLRLFCEGVPIFMLINGFLIFDKKFDAKKHARRTLKVFLIIIIWSVILDVFLTILKEEHLTLSGVIHSVLNTNISNSNTGVLWFLQKLIVVYLIFPVLKYLYDASPQIFDYLLIVLMISTYSVNLISMVAGIFDSSILNSILVFANQYSLVLANNIYVIYFMLGGYIYRNMDHISKKRCYAIGFVSALIACVIGITVSFYNGATYVNNFNYSQFFLMFTIVGLFLACSCLPLNNGFINKLLASLGDNTMGIYLLHRIVITAIDKYVSVSTGSLVSRLAMSFVVLLISWGITVLIRKIPKVSFIVKI